MLDLGQINNSYHKVESKKSPVALRSDRHCLDKKRKEDYLGNLVRLNF